MNETREIEIRHPLAGEVPPELMTGFEAFKIDYEWQWVLAVDGKIMAQLLGANTHGVLTIMRISSLPNAPDGWALKMLRQVLRECNDLGMIGFMTFLSDDRRAERRLMSMVSRAGGYLIPVSGVWASGRLETGY